MSRYTIVPDDMTVIVDGLPHRLAAFPPCEGIHAMQYDDGRVEVEYKTRPDGTRPRNSIHTGEEAQAMVAPFIEAWAEVNAAALATPEPPTTPAPAPSIPGAAQF